MRFKRRSKVPSELNAAPQPETGKLYKALNSAGFYKDPDTNRMIFGTDFNVGDIGLVTNSIIYYNHPRTRGPCVAVQMVLGEMVGWILTNINWEFDLARVNSPT